MNTIAIFAAGFASGLAFCFIRSSFYRLWPNGVGFFVKSRIARKYGRRIEVNGPHQKHVYYFWRNFHYS